MKYITLLIAVLFATPALAMGPWKNNCQLDIQCELDSGRSYHVKVPDGWDGETKLPVLMHFHGWQRTGALPVQHQRISGATRRRDVLLIAPNGNRKTWDFWDDGTEDVPFGDAVLADVAKNYPIDLERIYVSGYSYGSAMAWRFACESGNDIAALIAVSGTLNQDVICPEGPREVRHVHGTNDTVMDFPFGRGGDTTYPVKLWRDKFGCGKGQGQGKWNAVDFLSFDRTTWDTCNDGHKVTLDVHAGGHFIPHGWIARQLDELLGRTPTYP
jgi:polyhydroxybutyrate depolymerase